MTAPQREHEMAMEMVKLGALAVSRFILGGNPISGFSHQSPDLDREMSSYFTAERIKQTYREAERLGVNTHIGRADNHIARLLLEYWEEGGAIQWIAQTPPEYGAPEAGVSRAIAAGAKAVFVHGGQIDHMLINGRLDDAIPAIDMIHEAGLPAGVAGHLPEIFEWAEQRLSCDFYMCSYYNPVPRGGSPERNTADAECFDEADRERMAATIQQLSKPVIHYKILAGGRADPREAFRRAAGAMRPTDAVCVGIYPNHRPRELEEDVRLLEEALAAANCR